MDSFINYLNYANKLAKNVNVKDTTTTLHVVMGNESCDLDSMISALALAYLRHQQYPRALPVMNINSEEFLLHTENCYILQKLGIDWKLLIFRNNLDLDKYHSKGLLKLSLVDHHVLEEKDHHLVSSVVEIFDHRPIDPHYSCGEGVNTVIKRVGSCATLILDEIFSYCAKKTNVISLSLAVLLYSVIIYDTVAFSEEAGKVTPIDLSVVAKLVDQFNLSKDARVIFDELWIAHSDVSHLTPEQLLNKDVKVIQGVPMAGLPMLVEEFLKLPMARDAITNFCKFKNSNVVIIMGLHVIESMVHRDLAVSCCSDDKTFMNAIVKALENAQELCLCRAVVDVPHVIYFKQCNVRFSRKHILPIIKDALVSSV